MDKSNKELFKEELIFLDVEADDKFDFFKKIAEKLYNFGYVKDSFYDGLVEREKNYPTGLPTQPFCIAIPHCNPEHVIKESVSVVRFKEAISFGEMGQENKEILCKFAFVLTMKGVRQVAILSDLMKLFSDSSFMEKLNTSSKQEVKELIKNIE